MKTRKKRKLTAAGWIVGTANDFLELSPEEAEFVRVKLALAHYLKTMRVHKRFSQIEFARHIQSSQSRVAKMERGDPSVSVDLLMHSLFALGVTGKELAKILR